MDRPRRLDCPVPTHITFGRGAIWRTGSVTAAFGRTAVVVTGRHAAAVHGFRDMVLRSLAEHGVSAVVAAVASPNPTADEVNAAAQTARRQGADVVIGLGGGSAIDTAKAAAVVVPSAARAHELIGATLPDDWPALPIVAIPTTAGSGSEVTRGAIITDPGRRFRAGVRGLPVQPKAAIIDPRLVGTAPASVRTASAFDVLAHAFEGYLALRSTPRNKAYAVQAIHLASRHLPAVASGYVDAAAADDLCLAALLGGINVATAGTCLPHRLQQAMGSLPSCEISHGQGLAALYPAWLRHTQLAAPRMTAELAAALGWDDLLEGVGGLRREARLTRRLGDYGLTNRELEMIVQGVSGDLTNDPATQFDETYLRTLLQESL